MEPIRRGHSYAACFESASAGREGSWHGLLPICMQKTCPGIIGTDTLLFQQNSRIRSNYELFLTPLETSLASSNQNKFFHSQTSSLTKKKERVTKNKKKIRENK